MSGPVIVWFRNDLRITDNPALAAAAATGSPVVPVYVHEDPKAPWAPGQSRRWWRRQSLASLGGTLAKLGAALVIRRGGGARAVAALAAEIGAAAAYWNRSFEPAGRADDDALAAALGRRGAAAHLFNASLLFEPPALQTAAGQPYKVFTPFWRACLDAPPPAQPLPAPRRLTPFGRTPASDAPSDEPGVDLSASGKPGERAAHDRLDAFLSDDVDGYAAGRDKPALAATSRLAPYLAAGEIGPRQVWHATQARSGGNAAGAKFLAELAWREFAAHLLFHFPAMPEQPMRPEFARFPWRNDPAGLAAWQRGMTGYPIVDAGLRELASSGTMHNRVRMVAASFLTKHLLLPWQHGEAWFWDRLIDADLASNAMNWQWVAGCGADAAPYFRIFNPVLQGEKFDPDGAYVRRFVPELAHMPATLIHKPWQASPLELAASRVRLGEDYPRPVVDHAAARARALAAFASIRGAATGPEG